MLVCKRGSLSIDLESASSFFSSPDSSIQLPTVDGSQISFFTIGVTVGISPWMAELEVVGVLGNNCSGSGGPPHPCCRSTFDMRSLDSRGV